MEKFERNGVKFTVLEKDGEKYICTGNPTGEFQFSFSGEVADYYNVVGATSVVCGKKSIDELYETWLEQTEFTRNLGVKY